VLLSLKCEDQIYSIFSLKLLFSLTSQCLLLHAASSSTTWRTGYCRPLSFSLLSSWFSSPTFCSRRSTKATTPRNCDVLARNPWCVQLPGGVPKSPLQPSIFSLCRNSPGVFLRSQFCCWPLFPVFSIHSSSGSQWPFIPKLEPFIQPQLRPFLPEAGGLLRTAVVFMQQLPALHPAAVALLPAAGGLLPAAVALHPSAAGPSTSGYCPSTSSWRTSSTRCGLASSSCGLLGEEELVPSPAGPVSEGQAALPSPAGPVSVGQATLPLPAGPVPEGQAALPSPAGPVSVGQATLPSPAGPVPEGQAALPSRAGPVPEGQAALPSPAGPVSVGQATLPSLAGPVPELEGQAAQPLPAGPVSVGQATLPSPAGPVPEGQASYPHQLILSRKGRHPTLTS
jgi:hypothetical protein